MSFEQIIFCARVGPDSPLASNVQVVKIKTDFLLRFDVKLSPASICFENKMHVPQ